MISERVREILEREGLTGWLAERVQHRNPQKDTFPAMYQLLADALYGTGLTHELLKVLRKYRITF